MLPNRSFVDQGIDLDIDDAFRKRVVWHSGMSVLWPHGPAVLAQDQPSVFRRPDSEISTLDDQPRTDQIRCDIENLNFRQSQIQADVGCCGNVQVYKSQHEAGRCRQLVFDQHRDLEPQLVDRQADGEGSIDPVIREFPLDTCRDRRM